VTGVIVDTVNSRIGLANQAAMSATASYLEPCFAGVIAGVIGFSNGRVTIVGISHALSSANPPPTATVTTEYEWTRIGATAIVGLGKLATMQNKFPPAQTTLTWSDNNGTTVFPAQDTIGGVAVAAFNVFAPPALGVLCTPVAPFAARIVGVFVSD
jgi:hypothetical protein